MSHTAPPSSTSPQNIPTLGQLERHLSQALQSSYRQWTGHLPSTVLCHIVGRVVNVLIQDSITPLESLLQDSQARLVRDNVHERIRCSVAELVLSICGVSADNVMLDSSLDSGLTGVVVLLSAKPNVRNRKRKSSG